MSSSSGMKVSANTHTCQRALIAKVIRLFTFCFRKEMIAATEIWGSNEKFLSDSNRIQDKTKKTLDMLQVALAKYVAPPGFLENAIQDLESEAKKSFRPFVRWSKAVQIIELAWSTHEAAFMIMGETADAFASNEIITKNTTQNIANSFPPDFPPQLSAQLASMAPDATSAGVKTARNSSADEVAAEIFKRIQQLEMEKKGEISHQKIEATTEHKKHMEAVGDTSICECYFCTKYRAEHAYPGARKVMPCHQLCGVLMQACEKRGFTISGHYATSILNLNQGKLVLALKAVQKDLGDRETAIEDSGRLSFEVEKAYVLGGLTHNPSSTISGRNHLTRDMIVHLIEHDDERLQELDEKGWDSNLGKLFKRKDPKEQLEAFRAHIAEAKRRNMRAKYYAGGQIMLEEGKITAEWFKEGLEKFDNGNEHGSNPFVEENERKSIIGQEPDVALRSSSAVVNKAKGKDDGKGSCAGNLTHTDKQEKCHSAGGVHEKYQLTVAEKEKVRDGFENTLRQMAREAINQKTSLLEESNVNDHKKAAEVQEQVAEATSVKEGSKKKRRGKGKGKEKVIETPIPLPHIKPIPGPQAKCEHGCEGCRARARADAIRAETRQAFILSDHVPFQEYLSKMTGDMTDIQVKSLEMFMNKLSVKPEEAHVSEKRAGGGYDKFTDIQRGERALARGEQGLVLQVLMCSVEERERHKFLADKLWLMTGGRVSDREPVGGHKMAIQKLRLAFPSIKTERRAIEEIAIAGGNPELAFAFAKLREQYLEKQFGKTGEQYDEDEAIRFAAAVRYNIDLGRIWVGPDFESEREGAKKAEAEVKAKAKEETEAKAKEEAETKAKESKGNNQGKGTRGKRKGRGRKK